MIDRQVIEQDHAGGAYLGGGEQAFWPQRLTRAREECAELPAP